MKLYKSSIKPRGSDNLESTWTVASATVNFWIE